MALDSSATPYLRMDASEVAKAVTAVRHAAERELLDGSAAHFRIGWATRLRTMSAFRQGRAKNRERYDQAQRVAECQLRGLRPDADPRHVVCACRGALRDCVEADQAVRAYVNRQPGDILASRLDYLSAVVAAAISLGALRGIALDAERTITDLVAMPTQGSYLDLVLVGLAPAIELLQQAPDRDAEIKRLMRTGALDEVCSDLFQGQADLLSATVLGVLQALGDVSPREFVRRMERRREAARQVRCQTLSRLSEILPARLNASLLGCLQDIDELTTLDNREDTKRSVAFDGRADYMLRRAVFKALKTLASDLPEHVFEMHQDALAEMAAKTCETMS